MEAISKPIVLFAYYVFMFFRLKKIMFLINNVFRLVVVFLDTVLLSWTFLYLFYFFTPFSQMKARLLFQ